MKKALFHEGEDHGSGAPPPALPSAWMSREGQPGELLAPSQQGLNAGILRILAM